MEREFIYQNEYIIYKIGYNELYSAIQFVVETNYKIHNSHIDNKRLNQEINGIYESEKILLENSFFYVATDLEDNIIGTLRVFIGKNDTPYLCKFVNIDVKGNMCHIGRFAIDEHGRNKMGSILFKHFILIAFSHVCQSSDNVLVAECDVKLLKILKKMKIGIARLSEPFLCMGSETICVYAPYENIIEYYSNSKLLQQ